LRKALELDSSYAEASRRLGRAYLAQGLYEEARSGVHMASTLQNDPGPDVLLVWVYAQSGRAREVRQILETARQLADQGEYPAPSTPFIHAALGEKDESLPGLKKPSMSVTVYFSWPFNQIEGWTLSMTTLDGRTCCCG